MEVKEKRGGGRRERRKVGEKRVQHPTIFVLAK